MSAVSSPLASVRNPRAQLSSSFVHPLFRHRHLTSFLDLNQMIYKLLFATNQTGMLQLRSSRQLTVSAEYRDGGRPSSASIFVDGFVLGGIIVDAPGCVYAPQILFELLNIRFSVFFPKFFSDNFSQAVHKKRERERETHAPIDPGQHQIGERRSQEQGHREDQQVEPKPIFVRECSIVSRTGVGICVSAADSHRVSRLCGSFGAKIASCLLGF
ncbi:hypothetical protein ACJRO7_023737 [Eucalyptus globulus]|uniref:Uncharacterized protein n=1 Tax=Eucalyptus globulus TaxID=34317 RepID=A0ABD3KFP7_EUCGL